MRLRYTGAYNSSHDFDFSEGALTVEGCLTHQVEVRLFLSMNVGNSQFNAGYSTSKELSLAFAQSF